MRPTTFRLLLALLLLSGSGTAFGQVQNLWNSGGGSAWLTGSNWTLGNVPTALDTAQFGANPTAATGVGINFSNTTNAGTQTTGNRIEDVGAIEVTSDRTAAFLVGNSSSTAGATGTLRLNGATVNSIANTVLRNNSNQSFTIQNTQASGTQTMAVVLNSASNTNNIAVDGTGNIVISSAISGTGQTLALNAASTGDLRLSGTNTYSGGTTISGGTQGGRLRVDATTALPTTGTVAISTGGRMTLNVAGTFGGATQALTFNPNQTTLASLDILSGAAVTWQGTVAINADTRIEANGSGGSLTFSGNVSGSGTLIKQAAGNLILSGTGNTATGGTQVGNGAVTVNSGSSLGTGALTLAQTSANTTTVTLNNTAQSIGGLSSQFLVATNPGTPTAITQTLNLNGTALTINQGTDATFGNNYTGNFANVTSATSVIAGTGSLIKAGSATLTLSGANTYSGGTTISGGTLTLSGAGSINNTPTINVQTSGTFNVAGVTGGYTLGSAAAQTLQGTGSVVGAVTVASGSSIRSGTSAATNALSVTGNVTLAGGGGLGVDLFGASTTNAAVGRLNVTGAGNTLNIASGGASTIRLFNDAGLTAGQSYTFTIANATGGFQKNGSAATSFTLGTDFTLASANFSSFSAASLTASGNNLVLQFTPVPEPATVLAIGAAGLGALSWLRRRRNGKTAEVVA